MQGFNLSDDTIAKLQRKFLQFQNSRKRVHELLLDYVADYRQFTGSNDDRKEFLEGQFRHRVPDFSHLISSDNQIIKFSGTYQTLLLFLAEINRLFLALY